MKILTLILLLSFIAPKSEIDLGPPKILAICKITLKNGQSHEGFVVLAWGGYEGLNANGFYIHTADYAKKDFFNLNWVEKEEVEIFPQRSSGNVFYMNYSRGNASGSFSETPIFCDNDEGYLVLDYNSVKTYQLLKTLKLHTKVNMVEDYLYRDSPPNTTLINVDDIISFKLLGKPNAEWISKIEKERERFKEAEENSEFGYSTDYNASLWYHELNNNNKALRYCREELLVNKM